MQIFTVTYFPKMSHSRRCPVSKCNGFSVNTICAIEMVFLQASRYEVCVNNLMTQKGAGILYSVLAPLSLIRN